MVVNTWNMGVEVETESRMHVIHNDLPSRTVIPHCRRNSERERNSTQIKRGCRTAGKKKKNENNRVGWQRSRTLQRETHRMGIRRKVAIVSLEDV